MAERRTQEQLLDDFMGGQPEQLKMVNLVETVFQQYTEVVAFQAKFAGLPADFLWLSGAGAPVDYTDGDPAATGEGVAGIGSLYTDTTAAKLYINGGTKTEPIWKLVTSAA